MQLFDHIVWGDVLPRLAELAWGVVNIVWST